MLDTSSVQAQRPMVDQDCEGSKTQRPFELLWSRILRFHNAETLWHCCRQKTVIIPRVPYLLFTLPSLPFFVSCPKGSDKQGYTAFGFDLNPFMLKGNSHDFEKVSKS